MPSNVMAQGEVTERRSLAAPMSLIRPDRARPIDRIIDYFGGAHRRTAPPVPFHPRLASRRDDRLAKVASR